MGWPLAFTLFGAAVLLFPDGRLPSWHWRWPMQIYLALSTAWVAGAMVITVMKVARHQVRIDSSGDLAVIDHPTGAARSVVAIGNAYLFVLAVCLVAAVVHQAAGYRQASGIRLDERTPLSLSGGVRVGPIRAGRHETRPSRRAAGPVTSSDCQKIRS